MPRFAALALTLLVVRADAGSAQQVADTAFHPDVGAPAFAPGTGPRVVLDGGHHNFHTVDRRYRTFAELLRRDGFVVDGSEAAFTPASLDGVDVLVVANALNQRNRLSAAWALPTPSAFTTEEIDAVRAWVAGGGALLLIADHMPFPGAAHELAAAFGFELLNGFALEDGDVEGRKPLVFRRSDGSLADHEITDGSGPGARVDSVATFTGEAFRAPAGAVSLLTFGAGVETLLPDTAWRFPPGTPRLPAGGWSQGAVADVGEGRVAVFGEAAMFSAQLQTRRDGTLPMGMNAPVAGGNPRFLLNLIHWLARS